MSKKTMYLANQYGFASHSRRLVLPDLVRRLEEIGVEVWEPFARNNSLVFGPGNWVHDIATRNMRDIIDADGFFAVINGSPPDAGVMFELGVATAHRKPIFLLLDDFRRSTDNDEYPINLMAFTGLPKYNWQRYLFTSVEAIGSESNALRTWLDTENSSPEPVQDGSNYTWLGETTAKPNG